MDEIKRFGSAIRELTGGVDCDVVFEHVGAATFFTSVFVCRTFGTIVICGATSGFQLDFDVRYLWMRQKSIIGSHFANAYECQRANQLITEGKVQAGALARLPVERVPGAAPADEGEPARRQDGGAGRRGAGGRGPAGVSDRRFADPGDVDLDYDRDLGDPGEFPFTRGIHRDMYAGRPWSIRQYAGFGTAEETNRRFRFLIEPGQPALSTAFDLPTQMGMDSDDPMAEGEVGRVGVAINSVRDMEAMFAGIPLDEVSTSMTINAPAAVLVAMYFVACERQGRDPSQIRGTAQNDVLKEYVSRGTYIYPPRPSLRLAADLIEWSVDGRAALQRDLALGVPHARGGLHGRPGDGVRRSPTPSPTSRRSPSAASTSTRSRPGSRGSSTPT